MSENLVVGIEVLKNIYGEGIVFSDESKLNQKISALTHHIPSEILAIFDWDKTGSNPKATSYTAIRKIFEEKGMNGFDPYSFWKKVQDNAYAHAEKEFAGEYDIPMIIALTLNEMRLTQNGTFNYEASLEELLKETDFDRNEVQVIELLYQSISITTHSLSKNLSLEIQKMYMREWHFSAILNMVQNGISEEDIRNSVSNGNVAFRTGSEDLLEYFTKINAGVLILSAGIENVIRECVNQSSILSKKEMIQIAANPIIFENGNATVDKNVFFTGAKDIRSLQEKRPITFENLNIGSKKTVILFGDNLQDSDMYPKDLEEETNVIRIGLMKKDDDRIELFKENFDIVLIDDYDNPQSFEGITFWLDSIMRKN